MKVQFRWSFTFLSEEGGRDHVISKLTCIPLVSSNFASQHLNLSYVRKRSPWQSWFDRIVVLSFPKSVPDKTLHSSHVLGTTNIPFYDMIDSQTKTLKDKAGLQQGMEKSLPHSAIFSFLSVHHL